MTGWQFVPNPVWNKKIPGTSHISSYWMKKINQILSQMLRKGEYSKFKIGLFGPRVYIKEHEHRRFTTKFLLGPPSCPPCLRGWIIRCNSISFRGMRVSEHIWLRIYSICNHCYMLLSIYRLLVLLLYNPLFTEIFFFQRRTLIMFVIKS